MTNTDTQRPDERKMTVGEKLPADFERQIREREAAIRANSKQGPRTFTLQLDTDPYALYALRAYIEALEDGGDPSKLPLIRDLRVLVQELDREPHHD